MYIMRNEKFPLSKKILGLVSSLPYFELADLLQLSDNKNYLKTTLSRFEKQGKIVRLKKGKYVSADYVNDIQKKGNYAEYLEFMANILHPASYLSMECVLFENNVLTENPKNFTSVCLNKTAKFFNSLGNYFYHKIRKELFV